MWNSLSNIGFYENLLKEKNNSITKNEIDFKKLCRSCLRDAPDENNLLKVFEIGAMTIKNENNEDIRLIDMIISSTGLILNEIIENDNLPLQICNNCIQNVSGAYFFKMQTQQADETLKKIQSALNTSEIKNNSNIDNVQVSIPFQLINETGEFDNDENDKETCFEKIETIEETITTEMEEKDVQMIEIEYEEIIYDNTSNLTDTTEITDKLHEYQSLDSECIQNNDEFQSLSNEIESKNHKIDNALDTVPNNSQSESTLNKSSTKKSIKESDQINLQCPECLVNFHTKKHLIDHVRTFHPNVKAFECKTCHQKFLLYHTLKRHEKIHEANQKNKYCNFCDKSFTRNDDLKRHIRTHTNERPYSCTYCPKSYKQSSELKEHLLIHTANRQYFTCTICSKTLLSRNGMYVHMKVHANIRNHKCKKCDKKFVTSGELTSHIRHIHAERKRYLCDICHNYFNTIKSLKTHWNRRHNENNITNNNNNDNNEIIIKSNIKLELNNIYDNNIDCNNDKTVIEDIEKVEELLVNNENVIDMVVCGELEDGLVTYLDS